MLALVLSLIMQEAVANDVLSRDVFLKGILTGVLVSIFGQIVGGVFQFYYQGRQHKLEKERLELQLNKTTENLEKQLENTTKNLEKQLEQSEKNLKLQLKQSEENITRELLVEEKKESIEALWGIIYGDTNNYKDMKAQLTKFLNEPIGYYLPYDLYKVVTNEMNSVEKFIHDEELEAGIIPPDNSEEELDKLWAEWMGDLDPHEIAQMNITGIYNRFKTKLQRELRKAMSK